MGGNLLADLVQEEVRRRERVVAVDDEAVLLAPYGVAPALPAAARPAPAPRALRGRRADRRRAAARRAAAPGPPARARPPPLNLWVRTAPRGAEHYCWRIDVAAAPRPPRRARARNRRAPERRGAGAGRGRAARRVIAVAATIAAATAVGVWAERRWGASAQPPRARLLVGDALHAVAVRDVLQHRAAARRRQHRRRAGARHRDARARRRRGLVRRRARCCAWSARSTGSLIASVMQANTGYVGPAARPRAARLVPARRRRPPTTRS